MGFLQYCISAIQEESYLHDLIFVSLYGLIAYSFGMVIIRLFQQILSQSRWRKKVLDWKDDQSTIQLQKNYTTGRYPIIVLKHDGDIAMTAGIFLSKIYISTNLISRLSEGELQAVIWHEYAHCRHYDPLRLFLVRLIKDSLPFIPMFKKGYHHIQVWMELLADQYAIRKMKGPYELACVLMKCSERKDNNMMVTHVSLADVEINYRIKQLLLPNKVQVPLFDVKPLVVSSIFIIILSGVVASSCS
ncbi:M56 family metallopeptidase [Paenibacillus sp. MMO-177]|uniref:M56 family metallopeptidase n=1 Tax=Paenibacillus sp. MMO-177 TaxID=3081289 RepID=UPI003016ECCD